MSTEDIFDPDYDSTAQGAIMPESGDNDVDGDFLNVSLDLTEDSLVPGGYKAIPLGTWVDLTIFEAKFDKSTSDKNYGKPMYRFTLQAATDEWGKNRKFHVAAPVWDGAAFTYVAICAAIGRQADASRPFAPHVFEGQPLQGRVGQYAYGRDVPPGRKDYDTLKGYEFNQDTRTPNEDLLNPAFPRITGFRSMEEAAKKQAAQNEGLNVFKG